MVKCLDGKKSFDVITSLWAKIIGKYAVSGVNYAEKVL
jgi:hypothetical protein